MNRSGRRRVARFCFYVLGGPARLSFAVRRHVHPCLYKVIDEQQT
jgi:hypothetical protein